jgi:hypothetical protein
VTEDSAAGGGDDALGDFLARNRITLRIGSHLLKPGPRLWDRIRAAVEQSNEPRRFHGLPDELNAELLDPARVEAFLRYLPSIDPATTERLADRILYLNAPELGLGLGSPYLAGTIARRFELSVPAVALGRLLLPRLNASIDVSNVTARIAELERTLGKFNEQVTSLEDRLRQIDTDQNPDSYVQLANQLGDAKYRRHQASIVWRNLLRAAAVTLPGDAQLASEARAADQAVQRFAVPPRCGNDD